MAIHLRWFERRDGTVLLPPSDDIPCPADPEQLIPVTLN